MSIYVEKDGFTSNRAMWSSILTNMVSHGFTLVSIDGTKSAPGASIPSELNSFVVQANSTVDPLADEQPWRICAKITDDSTQLFSASPTQITDEGEISIVELHGDPVGGTQVLAGAIGGRRYDAGSIPIAERNVFFFHKGSNNMAAPYTGTMVFPSLNPDRPKETPSTVLTATDWSAMPLSYALAISDHGIALHTSIEGRDNEGCRQAWFCIQRAINADGTVVVEGKAPLFAVWSIYGGGSFDNTTLHADGIQRMTVREKDVNAPSKPVSAVQHSPDAFAVMNPLQQVPFSETGQFDFRLPQGFNSHRHSYPYEIDMIGYTSADVISNRIPIEIQVYGETDADGTTPKLRTYTAMSANSPNNTGMRLFLLSAGGGI